MFTCGYIIGMIPSISLSFFLGFSLTSACRLDNLMLQRVPPRIWFPLMQIVWGTLTFWYDPSFHLPLPPIIVIQLQRGTKRSTGPPSSAYKPPYSPLFQ